MADNARHGLLTPSVPSGVDVLRGLAFGAELTRHGQGWRFVERKIPKGWTGVALGSWWPAGALRDADVEWLLEDGFARREDDGARVAIVERGRSFLRQIDESVSRFFRMVKPLPIGELRVFVGNVRREHPDEDAFGLAQIAALHILAAIFGDDWTETHVMRDTSPTNFFCNAATEDHVRTIGRIRLIQFAEMVFNLQYVPGLHKTMEMIRDGDLEPGFAELEVGRILYVNGRTFEFVSPKGKKGEDYDLELLFEDVTACGETKCKLESTAISESTLLDTLNRGRKQLPPDRPGIIFVKVPSAWHKTDDEYTTFLQETTSKFWRDTKRIVSVKLHTSLLVQTSAAYVPTMLLLEVNNADNRFYPGRDWRMFRETKTPDGWVILMDECARNDQGIKTQ